VEAASASKLAQSSKISSSDPLAAPSPRARGEGGVRGRRRWAQNRGAQNRGEAPSLGVCETGCRPSRAVDRRNILSTSKSFSSRTLCGLLCETSQASEAPACFVTIIRLRANHRHSRICGGSRLLSFESRYDNRRSCRRCRRANQYFTNCFVSAQSSIQGNLHWWDRRARARSTKFSASKRA